MNTADNTTSDPCTPATVKGGEAASVWMMQHGYLAAAYWIEAVREVEPGLSFELPAEVPMPTTDQAGFMRGFRAHIAEWADEPILEAAVRAAADAIHRCIEAKVKGTGCWPTSIELGTSLQFALDSGFGVYRIDPPRRGFPASSTEAVETVLFPWACQVLAVAGGRKWSEDDLDDLDDDEFLYDLFNTLEGALLENLWECMDDLREHLPWLRSVLRQPGVWPLIGEITVALRAKRQVRLSDFADDLAAAGLRR